MYSSFEGFIFAEPVSGIVQMREHSVLPLKYAGIFIVCVNMLVVGIHGSGSLQISKFTNAFLFISYLFVEQAED